MAWWKTKSKTEPTKMEEVEMAAEEFMKVATTSSVPTPTVTVGASSYSHGYYFHGDDMFMLHELQKLANALGLKTAEDVRKVFGEIYEQQYTGFKVMIK